MELIFKTYRIKLKHAFGIARSSHTWYDIVYIYIIDGDIIGRGEAAPSLRYNESTERILSILKQKVKLPEDCTQRESIWNHVLPQLNGIKALEAAFSMALWDWAAQKQQKSVFDLLELNTDKMPLTSFTIAIGELSEIGQKIEEAAPYSILKVKLGTPNLDKEIMVEIRKHTDKLIRIDANEGWNPETALDLTKWLADQNVEFIEQPFPADQLENTAVLKSKSPLDIYADENSINSADIPKIINAFDGINIKLMKCGSLEEGKRMINLARFYDMKIMLGCMVESSVGISAAAQLAGEVDKVDLDGNLLINNDPYVGVSIKDGRIVLPEGTGLGLTVNSSSDNII
ncbi:MAG: dipeptide epimerase [Candidatus Marinimicrobia bacterium]|jgi:L-alanine-DL-glutamate epimerase-like enolase superfamily enzyme|nr:dipeptide epimerase [Candidatus Neomarinimicrobiota bacterium]MBT3502290.1 dipeptide epimerase [Candidatus Neomarinimicrobiota bacterium]MBT3840368.1 dipeptide epimerase [Candidatus Neomarinimicrobiota bacterium]MBT3998512.1 dipeptide epimerase [Candidatus Neomarinimicrobiota bacterium]MBT4578974.1 dipeptide epimerase [Candidatus Neomarinimicrobiota bacterium]